ncbi:MAG: PLP-dependent transferase [Patescibacteria group bacterium]
MADGKHDHRLSPETLAVQGYFKPELSEGSIRPPLFLTSTFLAPSAEALEYCFVQAYGLDGNPRRPDILMYSRVAGPNTEILEDRFKDFEPGASGCVSFASGMAAISTCFLAFCKPGDTILFGAPVYGGVDFLLRHIMTKFGVRVIDFDLGVSADEFDEIMWQHDNVCMVHVESPSNPTLMMADIPGIVAKANAYNPNILVSVDATVLGPVFQHSIELGADLVQYSATKGIGGHSDLIGGLVTAKIQDHIDALKAWRTILGAVMSPFVALQLQTHIETLNLRMGAFDEKGKIIARFFKEHSKIKSISYPGMTDSEEQNRRHSDQCTGSGYLMAFEIKGGQEAAYRFLNALKVCRLAVSLGGTQSLAEHPKKHTHSDVPAELQERFGITDGMIRLSVGLEGIDDLLWDFAQALEQA